MNTTQHTNPRLKGLVLAIGLALGTLGMAGNLHASARGLSLTSATGKPAAAPSAMAAGPKQGKRAEPVEAASAPVESLPMASWTSQNKSDHLNVVLSWPGHQDHKVRRQLWVNPDRLVLDVPATVDQADLNQLLAMDSRIAKAEQFAGPQGTRVVLTLREAYQVSQTHRADGWHVNIRGPRAYQANSLATMALEPNSPVRSEVSDTLPVKPSVGLQAWSSGLDDTGAELINLEFDQDALAVDTSVKDDVLRVRVQHAQVAPAVLKTLKDLQGRLFSQAKLEMGTQGLTVVVKLQNSRHQLRQQGGLLQISLVSKGGAVQVSALPVVATTPGRKVGQANKGISTVAAVEPQPLSAVSHYRGKPISLNFKDTDIRTVLQVFSEFTQLNLVLSDAVTGKVTVFLDSVPWDQALEIVLKSKNLIARKSGNVLLVSPQEDLAAATTQAQVIQSSDDLDPLVQRAFNISYQKTAYLQGLINSKESKLLSSRGSVIADERTSQLVVEDTPKRVEKIGSLIQLMDKPSKQVMIEAKVVLADTRVARELSASIKASQLSGRTLQGVPLDLGADGFVNTEVGAAVNSAYTLLTSNGTRFVNLQLRALENNNRVKTVSNPRVITSNKEAASIVQGTEIPYRVASSSGATSIQFRQATLKLEVTPQIAPDGTVLLDVNVAKDSVGQQTDNGLAIDTRSVRTKVVVTDGGTVVLGGIIEKGNNDSVRKIPLLGDIPGLGALFRATNKVDSDSELLIFITPVILNNS